MQYRLTNNIIEALNSGLAEEEKRFPVFIIQGKDIPVSCYDRISGTVVPSNFYALSGALTSTDGIRIKRVSMKQKTAGNYQHGSKKYGSMHIEAEILADELANEECGYRTKSVKITDIKTHDREEKKLVRAFSELSSPSVKGLDLRSNIEAVVSKSVGNNYKQGVWDPKEVSRLLMAEMPNLLLAWQDGCLHCFYEPEKKEITIVGSNSHVWKMQPKDFLKNFYEMRSKLARNQPTC